ncbi:MAG: KGK domain-containing protein [Crocosphaera sp.]
MSQNHILEHNEYLDNDDNVIAFYDDSMCKLGASQFCKLLKFSLEFIPDELEINERESPLDDIRQSMNQS